MSSIPGYTLEDFVEWNYNLVVLDDRPDVNPSLQLAELLTNAPPRPRIDKELFSRVVALFEPYRKDIEDALLNFDDEEQSWRDYCDVVCNCVLDEVYEAGRRLLNINDEHYL